MICLILAACLSAPVFAEEAGVGTAAQFDQWVVQGQSLNAMQAATLEQALLKDPLHAARRAKLLGYYYTQPGPAKGYPKDFKRHYAWWVQEDPRSPVFDSPHLVLWSKDPEMNALWQRALENFGKEEMVARHAALYFLLGDPRKSVWVCGDAIQAGAKDMDIYASLAKVLAREEPASKAELSRTLAYLESAYKYSQVNHWPENQVNFKHIARIAKVCGPKAKAKMYQDLADRAEAMEE
jgi:hypothetical protein